MKRLLILSVAIAVSLCFSRMAFADPLDLSTFIADPGVTESGGTVTFQEDLLSSIWVFYDPSFVVPDNATDLTFDFELSLGDFDYDDALAFEIDFNRELEVLSSGPGSFSIDLSTLRGSTVDMAWLLEWGGDFDAGTTATVSNIQLGLEATAIPEPGTVLLLSAGLGFIGLANTRKKRKIRIKS